MSLADHQLLVAAMVRDPSSVISDADRDRAIELALQRYGADVPRRLVTDVTWPSTSVFGPVPEGWSQRSSLDQVEYPVGRVPPATVFAAAIQTLDGWALELVHAVAAGSVVRVHHQAPHELQAGDAPADTVEPAHREAFASYAAALLCRQLAAHYSGQRETTVGADSVQTESRARNYAARAKEYRAAYFAGVGRPDPEQQGGAQGSGQAGASAVISLPGRPRNRLTRGVL